MIIKKYKVDFRYKLYLFPQTAVSGDYTFQKNYERGFITKVIQGNNARYIPSYTFY